MERYAARTVPEVETESERSAWGHIVGDDIEQACVEGHVKRLGLFGVVRVGVCNRRQCLIALGTEARPILRVRPNAQDRQHACSIPHVLKKLIGEGVGVSNVAQELDGAVEPGDGRSSVNVYLPNLPRATHSMERLMSCLFKGTASFAVDHNSSPCRAEGAAETRQVNAASVH